MDRSNDGAPISYFERMLKNLRTDIKKDSEELLKPLEKRIIENINKTIDKKISNVHDEISKIKERILYFEKHLRHQNIFFFGMEESEKSYEELEKKILPINTLDEDIGCSSNEVEMKSAEELRACSVNKRGEISESCDNVVWRPAKRPRTDPLVTLSSLLEDILNTMSNLPDVQQFLYPVDPQLVENYYRIVSRPMDLQTIRDNLNQKHYHSREEFLVDIKQIVINSTLFHGPTSNLTVAAQHMMQSCVEKLAEKEEQFLKLEKQINTLLDDKDQIALSSIFENILTKKLKVMGGALLFWKPVNMQIKDYYSIIKKPIFMETIEKKIQANKYHSREELLLDIQLLTDNCRAYYGPKSQFTRQAESVLKVAQEAFDQFDDLLSQLETNIARIQQKMLEDAEQPDVANDLTPTPSFSDEKPGRGQPKKLKKKLKPSTSTAMADDATQRKRVRVEKDPNSLVDDSQYPDSEKSGQEEVEQKDAAEATVPLFVPPEDELTEPVPWELLIKRESPSEVP